VSDPLRLSQGFPWTCNFHYSGNFSGTEGFQGTDGFTRDGIGSLSVNLDKQIDVIDSAMIMGIMLGVLAGGTILALVIYLVYKYKKNRIRWPGEDGYNLGDLDMNPIWA
jgi:hypothetical protein